jgi:hypothetical protein
MREKKIPNVREKYTIPVKQDCSLLLLSELLIGREKYLRRCP